jgi:spermidine/putrescine transport system substrate-binding protein
MPLLSNAYRRVFQVLVIGLVMVACGTAQSPTANPNVPAAASTPTAAAPAAAGNTTLDIYNWGTFIDPQIVSDFEAAYNVKVNYTIYDNDSELLADLEAKTHNRDVIFPSDYMVAIMREKGLLHPLNKTNVPNITNLDPIFTNTPYDPGNRYCVPFQWGTIGIGYNIKATGRELTSWNDLFDPAFKGRVALLDDARASLGAMLIHLGYSPNTTNRTEIAKARDLILSNIASIAAFAPDTGQDLLISGTVDLALEWSGDILQVSKTNPDIRYVIPDEGSFITTTYICVAGDADHAALAEQFVNYVLEPKVSAAISNFILYSTPNSAAIPLLNQADRENPMIYPPEKVRDELFFLVDVGADNAAIYDQAWTAILAAQR